MMHKLSLALGALLKVHICYVAYDLDTAPEVSSLPV
jgi:hypothetical protein